MSAEARWTWAGSVAVQCGLAALLLLLPLLHPERMVMGVADPPRVLVPLQVVKVREAVVKRVEAASSTTHAVAAVANAARAFAAPTLIPHGVAQGDTPPMGTGDMKGMGMALPGEISTGTGTGVRVAVMPEARPRGPMRVSSGVGAGMLLGPIRPVYPAIARAARVEGSVVVEATISRDGRMEQARVISGPAMLAGAALQAVREARYAPYRLNGEPTEVETTITVNFRMGA